MIETYSLKSQGNLELSRNFRVREFRCHDGSDLIKVDAALVHNLQRIRDWFGRPVYIGSAYRTPEYNARIGGADGSYHMLGRAADFDVGLTKEAVDARIVAMVCEAMGILGIGRYIHPDGNSWIHIDTRTGNKSLWTQSKAHGPLTKIDTFLPTLRRQRLIYTNQFEAAFLQKRLNELSFYRLKIDGKFGPGTDAAVREFQRRHNLVVDGIVGPVTWRKLIMG